MLRHPAVSPNVDDDPEWTDEERFHHFAEQFEDPLQNPYGPSLVWEGILCSYYRGRVYKYQPEDNLEFWGKVEFQRRGLGADWKVRFYFQRRPLENNIRVWAHSRGRLAQAEERPWEQANSPQFWHNEWCVKCFLILPFWAAPHSPSSPSGSDVSTEGSGEWVEESQQEAELVEATELNTTIEDSGGCWWGPYSEEDDDED